MEKFSKRFENIISISSIPIAVLDTNMCCLAVSEQWINLYQLQGKQLIGKSFYGTLPGISDGWKKIHRECLQGKDQSNLYDRFARADGSAVHVKWDMRHFNDDYGRIGGMMMTCEDITKDVKTISNGNRFQPFMDHFPGLCWISGIDHSFRYGNKCFYDALHLTDKIIGKKSAAIFGDDIANTADVRNEKVLKSGIAIEFEQTSRDPQGHPQFYKIYKFRFRDAKGEENIGSVAFDITKNTLLLEELDRSEAQFKLAFEHSQIGMALINPDGTFRRINDSLCEILGYSEKQLKTLSIHELTHLDDKEKSLAVLGELSSRSIERLKFEKRYIHSNGKTIWVIIAATMLYANDGKPLYYISQIEDITKRKEIENNLILSEKKYRTIFENVQDVFYQTDKQGLVIEISPSIKKYSGYEREQIIGKPVADFYFYPQDRERIMESLLTNGSVIDFEVRLKTINQELRYASVNARLVLENGNVISTEGSMRDVTSRKFQENTLKTLNLELTESNQAKNKLMSIIGHDLRNPIGGSLQLLNMTLDKFDSINPTDIKTYLLAMTKELSNANNLLEHLLDWAKLQFNAVTFNPLPIKDIAGLIDRCLKTILPMATKKNIKIKIAILGPILLEADSAMLETIIRNLMSNAIKFTKPFGHVDLSVKANELGTKFAVKDSGIGIPREKIALLFGQNSFSTFGTQGEKGTGLGLGLCADFIARHKGQIWAESETGKGSSFFFTIPIIASSNIPTKTIPQSKLAMDFA
ncbi:PAS domain S-box-containing protein [Pedobacter sp. UYEF25]